MLLSPKSISAQNRNQDCASLIGDAQRDTDRIEIYARRRLLGCGGLETEELCDEDPLHGKRGGGAHVSEKCPFEG